MAVSVVRADRDTDPDVADIAALEPTDGDLLRWDSDGTRYSGIQPSALSVTSTGGTSKTLAAWTDDILDITTDSGIVYAADYITVGSTSDQSTAMQNALTAATGGKLVLPEATIFCKELSRPNDTTIVGVGQDKSILKLPNGADTYLIASSTYVNNDNFSNLEGESYGFTLDGNSANQTVAKPLEIVRGYRALRHKLRYYDSKGQGCLLTALSANGTATTNGLAGCTWDDCAFDLNDEEGWYGEDGASTHVADWIIRNCEFYGNGGTTKYNCYSERSAGAKFIGNQMYTGGIGEAYFDKAGRMVISGNHIDITTAGATTGNVYGMRVVLAGHPTVAITGNQFHNSKASAGSVTWQHLSVSSAEADAIASVAGNTFYSESFTHTAWAHTGSGFSCDDANTYYQSTQPSPSATVRRGLQSNASGTWTIDQAVAINAALTQSLAGGSSVGISTSGEGVTSYTLQRHGSSGLGPAVVGYSARGTIASPSSINQFDETFRIVAGGYSSSAFRDAGYIRHYVFAATPSSTDMEGQWRIEACAAGSASVTEISRFSHANGFAMFGANTVVDAARGIRGRSYTSTELDAIGNAVNTAAKAAGKMVWNSTVSKPVWAVGSTAASVWVDGAGTTVNTPV